MAQKSRRPGRPSGQARLGRKITRNSVSKSKITLANKRAGRTQVSKGKRDDKVTSAKIRQVKAPNADRAAYKKCFFQPIKTSESRLVSKKLANWPKLQSINIARIEQEIRAKATEGNLFKVLRIKPRGQAKKQTPVIKKPSKPRQKRASLEQPKDNMNEPSTSFRMVNDDEEEEDEEEDGSDSGNSEHSEKVE